MIESERNMERYKMLVLSRPVEGQESQYNDWYQNTHLKQIVALPGFISAQRFQLEVDVAGANTYPYMAIYEMETTDINLTLQDLQDASSRGIVETSAYFDYETVSASVFKPFGPSISRSMIVNAPAES